MLLFHLKCLSLQTSTYNLGRAEWRTSKVSKPLPILFLPDDNFLIYSYILFSATFVKEARLLSALRRQALLPFREGPRHATLQVQGLR